MKEIISINLESSALEKEDTLHACMRLHGYYKWKSNKGIKYERSDYFSQSLYPLGIQHYILIAARKEMDNSDKMLTFCFKGVGSSWFFTKPDEDYFKAFFAHLKESIASGQVIKFENPIPAEKRSKYRNIFILSMLLFLVIAILLFALTDWPKLHFWKGVVSTAFPLLAGPLVAKWIINFLYERDR